MALMLDPKTSEVLPTSAVEADEWTFEGCTKGSPIPLGHPVALVNLRRGAPWVGCKRHGGEAYCWDDECARRRRRRGRCARLSARHREPLIVRAPRYWHGGTE